MSPFEAFVFTEPLRCSDMKVDNHFPSFHADASGPPMGTTTWELGPCNDEKMVSNLSNHDKKRKASDSSCRSKNKDTKSVSRKKSDPSEAQTGYIHVRARRGEATDSHSLAERVRRERISERMKFLQNLVPGCSNITGKALILDEIINYVQSLQRQIEFLSLKLAVVNTQRGLDYYTISKKIECSNRGLWEETLVGSSCYNGLQTMGVVDPYGFEFGKETAAALECLDFHGELGSVCRLTDELTCVGGSFDDVDVKMEM